MTKCPKCGHEFKDAGRSAGGKARAKTLSAAKRHQIAQRAAKVRWWWKNKSSKAA